MTQLFSNEYFGIGLIITIAFLTILFIIVLIMALKDAKKRKNEEVVKEEKEKNTDFAFQEQSEEIKLEVPKIKEDEQVKENNTIDIVPTTEDTKEKEEPVMTSDDEEFKTADFSFTEIEKEKEAVDNEPTVKIDFEALAESLKAELDKEATEEIPEENTNNFELNPNELFQNNKEESNRTDEINLEELKKFASELQAEESKPLLTPNEETIKIVPEENSNENVYLNNESEKVVKEEKVFEPVKMKVPNIVMPKFASHDDVKVAKVEPVEDKKEPEAPTPSFENIENETFSLK